MVALQEMARAHLAQGEAVNGYGRAAQAMVFRRYPGVVSGTEEYRSRI